MDYVEWCDTLADAIADYADHQYGRYVHLHQFASEFLAQRGLSNGGPAWNAAVMDSHHMLRIFGLVDWTDTDVRLTHQAGGALRDRYARWRHAQSLDLRDTELLLLDTLNRLSPTREAGFSTVEEVDIGSILAEAASDENGHVVEEEVAYELFDNLEAKGLLQSHKTLGYTGYKSSYLGMARTRRSQVANDREIDLLRTHGEGDTLDYKRHYSMSTSAQKWEFAKDITALANAGGAGPRFLLLGVEDNGEFYRPQSEAERASHRKFLDETTETRLQQVVGSRTTHSPSIRVRARGDHRDGPYVLIEIVRNPAHVPYRIYADQTDRMATDADNRGEVWIRKGSTKAQATAVEVEALELQAALYLRAQNS